MTPYLDKVATYIFGNFNNDFNRLCVVLPGRRAALFLKKYLTTKIDRATWAPEIFSIEDFIEKHAGVNILDRLSLLFELYEVHKEIEKAEPQRFDEFIKWGQQLLSDFNEVDLYMVDPKKIYNYLNETRALSVWNLNSTPLTQRESDYLKFYNSLSVYYFKLKDRLLKKSVAFQGMAYRMLANSIEERSSIMPWKNIIFAGFNALTSAEEVIINHLSSGGVAEVLWDADAYYLNDKNQEAGKFLRNHLRKNKKEDFKWIENSLIESAKKFNIIGVPKNIGQVKLLGQILEEISEKDENIENSAVVLADENLLIPVLHSIPDSIKNFNITMGLPLRYTQVFDLIDTLFSVYEYAEEFRKIRNSEHALYYHKIVDKLLSNFYIHALLSDEKELPFRATALVSQLKKAFLTSGDIIADNVDNNVKGFYLRIFPDKLPDAEEMIKLLGWLLEEIRDMLIRDKETSKDVDSIPANTAADIELEYLYSFSLLLKRLKSLSDEFKVFEDIKTLAVVLRQMVKQITVPFYGEPLKGLQIMGMLETRTLDFKNLIVLSVNENILPAAKSVNSYIPHEIRKEFNLPTYKDKDSIFAYHFYRLLQRCETAFLLYNTESDDLKAGEQSRFLKQLVNEMPKVNPQIKIEEKIMILPYKEIKAKPIIIEKNDEIIDKLRAKANSGFSPSVLNSYIQCTLKFYFEQILGLKEREKPDEEIDPKIYGSAIHEALKILYMPYLNRRLLAEDIKEMSTLVETTLRAKFSEMYNGADISYGKNLLTVKTAEIILQEFLKNETQSAQKNEVIIKVLETGFKCDIIADVKNSRGESLVIKLKGNVDRIDSVNNTLRIIDYKTGKVEVKNLKIREFDQLIRESQYAQAFQLMMYSFLYFKNNNDNELKLNAGILSFKDINKGLKPVTFNEDHVINNEIIEKFYAVLKQLLEEIFDKSKVFSQTEDQDNCRYCPFINICNRWNPVN